MVSLESRNKISRCLHNLSREISIENLSELYGYKDEFTLWQFEGLLNAIKNLMRYAATKVIHENQINEDRIKIFAFSNAALFGEEVVSSDFRNPPIRQKDHDLYRYWIYRYLESISNINRDVVEGFKMRSLSQIQKLKIVTNGKQVITCDTQYKILPAQLKKISRQLSVLNADFIPSYPYIKAHKIAEEYSKIIFLHIPKCAGTSFISAFTLNNYFNANTLSDDCELSLEENPLIVDNVFSEREIDYLQAKLPSDINKLFISIHGRGWSQLSESIKEKNISRPRIVTILRNSADRLKSQLMMDGYLCQSVRELKALIKHRPFDYDNAMTRYILDKPEGRISENDISIANELITSGQILAFDIRNSHALCKLKTLHLSSMGLPNVIQPKRMNSSKRRKQFEKESQHKMTEIYNGYVNLGWTDADSRLDMQKADIFASNLIKNFDIDQNASVSNLTLIINEVRDALLVKTEKLIRDPSLLEAYLK